MVEFLFTDTGSVIVFSVTLLVSLVLMVWHNRVVKQELEHLERETIELRLKLITEFSKQNRESLQVLGAIVNDFNEQIAPKLAIETPKHRLAAPDNLEEITLLDGSVMHVIDDKKQNTES